MKVLELFSGTESFSKVFKENGHETFTIDNGSKFMEFVRNGFNIQI
jgi:hypothetical protein